MFIVKAIYIADTICQEISLMEIQPNNPWPILSPGNLNIKYKLASWNGVGERLTTIQTNNAT